MRSLPILILSMGTLVCQAQDVIINGNSGQPSVLQSTNTSTSNNDRPAVYGISKPQPSYGIGVKGEGSYMGVFAIGGGSTSTFSRYGVYATASGGGTNYGIYAYAPTSGSSYAGYFAGNVRVTGTITSASDKKLKKNILPLGPSLDKVTQLLPKTYVMRTTEFPTLGLAEGLQDGLIAEDVEAVLPELVNDIAAPAGDRNSPPQTFKGVNYIGMIPVLIKAIQEQQAQITALQTQILLIRGQVK